MIARAVASVRRVLDLDRSIIFNLSARAISIVAQPLTLVLIASRLSAEEQGYYYTFYSLLALSFFLELGLGVVLTQFASHEFGQLRWTFDRRLEGDAVALGRLLRLIRMSIKWYAVLLLILVVALIPAGLVFLTSKHAGPAVSFRGAWALLIVLFGLNTLFVPMLAILEGCAEVATVQLLRALQTLFGTLFLWTVLLAGGKLFAIPAQFGAYLVCASLLLITRYRGLLRQALSSSTNAAAHFSWKEEVLPMQWRVALTTAAAYFAGGVFTPFVFRYQGPAVAGAVGLSLTVAGAVGNVGLAWVTTKAPLYGGLVRIGDRAALDRLAGMRTRQGIAVCVVLFVVLVFATGVARAYFPVFGKRVLPPLAIAELALANLAAVLFQSMSAYLRAFKREPLFPVSVAVAGIMSLMAWLTTRFIGADAMVTGFMLVNCGIMLPVSYLIFRRERHAQWSSAERANGDALPEPWTPE